MATVNLFTVHKIKRIGLFNSYVEVFWSPTRQ